MSYIGNAPSSAAFLTDTFSGNASTTAFTMSVAPANTSSMLVAITGVVQDPSTYSVAGTTLTFSAAPPTGTSNISVRYLGIPASGVTTTAYRTVTNFTATSGQTTFSVPSYTVGYIDVYRNGVRLAAADYTASTGTTVVLANACTVGDSVVTESFYVSSVLNAIPATAGAVNSTYIANGAVGNTQMAAGAARANFGAGAVLQVVQGTTTGYVNIASTSWTDTGLTATITPSSTSSKILIMYIASLYHNAAGLLVNTTITKNGTQLSSSGIGAQSYNTSGLWTAIGSSYLDSPASTAALTYKIQAIGSSATTFAFGADAGRTTAIILMEIAG